MGWADKAVWKHVTGLVGATLHKRAETEKKIGQTLEQQQQPVSQSWSALQERQDASTDISSKTYVTRRIRQKKTTRNDNNNDDFILVHAHWLFFLSRKISLVWMMRF